MAEGWLVTRHGAGTWVAALVVGYGTPPDHAYTAALARLLAVIGMIDGMGGIGSATPQAGAR